MQSILPITTDDFKAKSNIVISKVEIDSDGVGTYIVLPDIKDISITTNIQNVVSRFCSYSFSITCLNIDDQFSPFKGSSPYYRILKRGRKLKIYMGIKKAEVEYYWQWQICIIDDIKLSESAGEKICTINGRDLMGLLLDYKLYYPNTFWGGTIYLDTEDGKMVYQLPNIITMGLWDIRGAYRIGIKKVSTEASQPISFWISNDGTKMYILDNLTRNIFQYTLSTAWDIETASYDSVYFYVGSQESEPTGLAFSEDGTKMYVVGDTNAKAYQYDLTIAWDISSATYSTKYKSLVSENAHPNDIFFSLDGTKMYVVAIDPDYVYQYNLSTEWDVSTAVYASKYCNVGLEENTPRGIFLKNDGTKMYIVGDQGIVFQYTLETPWDVSTANYDQYFRDISDDDSSPMGVFFKSDGSLMYIVGYQRDSVFEYILDDEDIGVPTGIYELSVDDIEPRDGEDEDGFSLLSENTDFIYNKWENTITFGGSGGLI